MENTQFLSPKSVIFAANLYQGLAVGFFLLRATLSIHAMSAFILVMFRQNNLTTTTELCNNKGLLHGQGESELIKIEEHRVKRITVENQIPTEGDIGVSLETVIRYK